MTEIVLHPSMLPTIPDKNSWTVFVDEVDKKYSDWGITYHACWRNHRNWLIFGLTLFIAVLIVVLILLFQPTPPSFPCLAYQPNTLASSVSVACLQYLWNLNCRTPYAFPSGYTGWWIQSPQGTAMVSCYYTQACGVGSYGNIAMYMQMCDVRYQQ